MLKPLSQALTGWRPGSGGPPRDPLALLSAGWADIVGEDVARHCRPARLAGEMLLIATRSSAWSHQLSLLSEHILAAVAARLPKLNVRELRFRVGKIADVAEPSRSGAPRARRRGGAADSAARTGDALARFRAGVEAAGRAKRAAGWKECLRCAALIAPGDEAFCLACEDARARERTEELARLLFDAPWLGYAGTAELVAGLSREEYDAVRTRLLASWWETLMRALEAQRVSRDGRERLIASSYVVLRTQLPPEVIAPATVRNALGDELHDLIYGTEYKAKHVE